MAMAMTKMTKKISQRIIWHELARDLTDKKSLNILTDKKSLNILAVIHSQDLRGLIFAHKMTYKKRLVTALGHWYANWYLYGEHHCKGCEICGECDDKVSKPGQLCENCEYIPDYGDAFSKWGHNNGGSCRCSTGDIVDIIEGLGYDCCGNPDTEYYDAENNPNEGWGSHNFAVITKIVRVSDGQVVYPIEGFQVGGYDDRGYFEVLPDDIVDAILYYTYC